MDIRPLTIGILLLGMSGRAICQAAYWDPESQAMKQTVTVRVPMARDNTQAMQLRDQLLKPPAGIREVPNNIPKELVRHFIQDPSLAQATTKDDLVQQLSMPGSAFPGPGINGWTPGDPNIAVGPNNIVAVINGRMTFHSKTGAISFNVDPYTFYSSLPIGGANPFDPRAWYDRSIGRFWISYALATNGRGYNLIGLSDDSNPNGNWTLWMLNDSLNNQNDVADWADYPGLGGNDDFLVLTMNMYLDAGGGYGKIRLMSKTQFVNGSSTISWTDFWNFSNPAFGHGTAWSLQPARHIGPSAMPLIANISGANRCNIYGIQNPGTSPTLKKYGVAVNTFAGGPNADQKGTVAQLSTVGDRIYDVAARDSHILVTHNITGGGGCCIRWYDINVSAFPPSASVIQQGNIEDAIADIYYGAPQMNQFGVIGTGVTKSSAAEYASLYFAGREPSDPLGTMQPLVLKKSGTSPYGSSGVQRWGDYQGGAVDPYDETTFWAIAMVPVSGIWATEIYSYQLGALPASLIGTITLDQWVASRAGLTANLELRNPGTTTVAHTYPITLSSSGHYSLPNVAIGTWDVAVKFSHWLRAKATNRTISNGSNLANFVLTNGDAFADNSIDLGDLNQVMTEFGTASTDTDLDGSGLVDLPDLNIVLTNFAMSGAQ